MNQDPAGALGANVEVAIAVHRKNPTAVGGAAIGIRSHAGGLPALGTGRFGE